MIAKKDPSDKSLLDNIFQKLRELDKKSREKMVQRHIFAVKKFIAQKRQKNPHFSWNFCPWPVQFLPVLTKFSRDFGKINAVNPALSGFSGLMGMNKTETNSRIDEKFRPRNLFLSQLPKSREILEKKFFEKYQIKPTYPLIFKPSVGERATGVNFVREDQVINFLAENSDLENIILEEFVQTNAEFGLSWLRNPITNQIEILSLVQKKTPQVIGDGEKTLQQLIIEKCAELNLDKSREKKILAGFSVSELAEKIVGKKNIVRTASVSYGTSFKKIALTSEQKTELVGVIKKILKNFAGIYAGRFDIKANSVEEIFAEKCKILEMNGVGGTPLEIYDNDFSVDEKYEVLFNYFSRVFQIADKNITQKTGTKVSRLVGLTTLARNFFGQQKTQELPENVWQNLREVFQISFQKRFQDSALGEIFEKFRS